MIEAPAAAVANMLERAPRDGSPTTPRSCRTEALGEVAMRVIHALIQSAHHVGGDDCDDGEGCEVHLGGPFPARPFVAEARNADLAENLADALAGDAEL